MDGTAARLLLLGAAAVVLPVAGVATYTLSSDHGRHDPQHALQQLDLLSLDEPAPGLAGTGAPPGRAVVLLFCNGCDRPVVRGATVVAVHDAALAQQYGLGRPGASGYALVDRHGHVRYRTYDPDIAAHTAELQTLVDGLHP